MSQRVSQVADTKSKWRLLVGTFILAFGDIELATFYLWNRYFPSENPPANFKERASKVLGPLRSDSKISAAVAGLLVDALRLADKRNTVAHHRCALHRPFSQLTRMVSSPPPPPPHRIE